MNAFVLIKVLIIARNLRAMDLQKLKASLANAMHLLEANRAAAYAEWMDGSLPRGAFEYVNSRLSFAQSVMAGDCTDPLKAFNGCALVTIDIRSAVDDAKSESAYNVLSDWLACYSDAGFTGSHIYFKTPIIPSENFGL